ncbi:DUF4395 family protein [Marispirochaeta sp.]|uniref:DUF4395 family protein n=1 Tax=Marispirochaeta sp. TaxID=2038653 RepID=UPI0029C6E9EA|nr:DUF4395 family protein [Marispirochaeta sp.]
MVNERVIRGIAIQVFVLSLAALALVLRGHTPASFWILAFLLADFTLRSAGLGKISLTAALAKALAGKVFSFRPRLISAKPKRFAAGIGAFISLASGLLLFVQIEPGAALLLAVLALFSFLEWAVRFCAGCRIFALLVRLGLASDDLCVDCVLPDGNGI